MSKQKIYKNKDLIEYGDTIRLHFDETGTYAWLVLKNYGGVFNNYGESLGTKENPLDPVSEHPTKDQVFTAVIGKPVEKPFRDTISLGQMLNPNDVIRFQRAIAGYISTSTSNEPILRADLYDVIETGIKALGFPNPHIDRTNINNIFYLKTCYDLGDILKEKKWLVPPKNGVRGETISQAIRGKKELGFTAYFPKPSLIREEERTAWSGQPKTDKHDPRYISLIPAASPRRPKLDLDSELKVLKVNDPILPFIEYFKHLDELIGKDDGTFKDFQTRTKKLHAEHDRVWCYAFRGQTRGLEAINKQEGIHASMTRTDDDMFYWEEKDGVRELVDYLRMRGPTMKIKEVEQQLRNCLKPKSDGSDFLVDYEKWKEMKPEERVEMQKELGENLEAYMNLLHMLQILHLGVYVGVQNYKGYVSASRSTAIAKRFANWYSKTDDCTAYCLAVRCRGGFALASKDVTYKDFSWYHEQEVAVPGGIGWHDVVGMRVVSCSEKGQFFSGPVFLQDALRKEKQAEWEKELVVQVAESGVRANDRGGFDRIQYKYPEVPQSNDVGIVYSEKRVKAWLPEPDDAAFGELFELLSGRSQGNDPEIFKCYETDKPWDE